MKIMMAMLLMAILTGCAQMGLERRAEVDSLECNGLWENVPSWCLDRN
jgi:hypothetical protein